MWNILIRKVSLITFEEIWLWAQDRQAERKGFFMLIFILRSADMISSKTKICNLNIIIGKTDCQIFEWKPFLLNKHFDIVTHFIVLLTMFLTAFQAVKTGPKAKVINTDECSTVHYICWYYVIYFNLKSRSISFPFTDDGVKTRNES